MKKVSLLLFLLLTAAFFSSPLAAQQFSILEVETSTILGYDLNTDEIYNDSRLGVNFNFNNAVIAGFMFQDTAQYLVLRYPMTETLSTGILIGENGVDPSAGVQLTYTLLSNQVQALFTSLKLGLEYIVPDLEAANAVQEGLVGVSLGLGFGM